MNLKIFGYITRANPIALQRNREKLLDAGHEILRLSTDLPRTKQLITETRGLNSPRLKVTREELLFREVASFNADLIIATDILGGILKSLGFDPQRLKHVDKENEETVIAIFRALESRDLELTRREVFLLISFLQKNKFEQLPSSQFVSSENDNVNESTLSAIYKHQNAKQRLTPRQRWGLRHTNS